MKQHINKTISANASISHTTPRHLLSSWNRHRPSCEAGTVLTPTWGCGHWHPEVLAHCCPQVPSRFSKGASLSWPLPALPSAVTSQPGSAPAMLMPPPGLSSGVHRGSPPAPHPPADSPSCRGTASLCPGGDHGDLERADVGQVTWAVKSDGGATLRAEMRGKQIMTWGWDKVGVDQEEMKREAKGPIPPSSLFQTTSLTCLQTSTGLQRWIKMQLPPP